MFVGKDFTPATISSLIKDGPAEKAGLMVNDVITEVNGHKVVGIRDVSKHISISLSKEIEVKVNRNEIEETFVVMPEYIKSTKVNLELNSLIKKNMRII